MTTRAQLRKASLALPDVTEHLDGRVRRYLVGEAEFARCDAEDFLTLALPPTEATALAADAGADPVTLADLDGQQLNHWVRRAWRHAAPQELVDARDEVGQARAGQVGDLPRALGTPATRALVGAGVRSLDDAAERSPSELLDLHGVGRRGVAVLASALTDRDLPQWRDPG